MEAKELKVTVTDPVTGRVLVEEMIHCDQIQRTLVVSKCIDERPCEMRVSVRLIETLDGRMSIEE